jgi:CRISPR/Cas system CSM-associated protein Csm3 (group 7 of RAMP superfamily)
MPRNYDFVDFPPQVNTKYVTDIKERYGKFSGVIPLEMIAVDRVYPGSGSVSFDSQKGLVSEPAKEHGKAVIFGSSVKGAVRHVARAVSDGCIPNEDGLELLSEQKDKCKVDTRDREIVISVCIVCDLFGTMGLASKVNFSDFIADDAQYEACRVPDLFSPHITKPHYLYSDGCHKGYKFYRTECEPDIAEEKKNWIYTVKAGTVFHGEVRFRGLDETELCLLMYSLGIEKGSFSHKLGGYRAKGFGTVNVRCKPWILNGEPKTPDDAAEFSHQYIDNCSDDCYDQIKKLEEIMQYKEGGK